MHTDKICLLRDIITGTCGVAEDRTKRLFENSKHAKEEDT